ncbi:VOC family protein [Nocardia sp. NPDC052566]|uniref:VOC family protein n=1 Tax=Nocardia sp. NPDC052566 TaxID=3364330 RepID=UPI0037C9867A
MIRWIWAFIDRPTAQFEDALAFWTAATATHLSPRRGDNDEFVTLLPAHGDPCIKAQAVGTGGGVHIDLDVEDVREALTRAEKLGATVIADHDTYVIMSSPQGQVFCLTGEDGGELPAPAVAPDGTLSKLDQICIDVGPSGFQDEARFWAELTGWQPRPHPTLTEFIHLIPDRMMPVRILLQRVGEERPTSAHLDLACSDISALADWHETLGARKVRRGGHWIVMTDPTGYTYCLTGRDPKAVHGKASA